MNTTTNHADNIRSFLAAVADGTRDVTPAVRSAVERALFAVYANQTADEQSRGTTDHLNGKGFNGRDAQFGTSLVQSARKYGSLSPRQTASAAKMLKKYARQIAEACPAKA